MWEAPPPFYQGESAVIVINKEMYHITRDEWYVGDTIIVGKAENPFWVTSKQYNPSIVFNNQIMALIDMTMYETIDFDVTKQSIDWLYDNLKRLSRETAISIREQAFEKVRRRYFPFRPSRQRCLWVTQKENLIYWKTQVTGKNQHVLKLHLTGEIFQCDDRWLKLDTLSCGEYENRAKEYWKGTNSNAKNIEYLFYGKAIVKEVLPIF